MCSIEGLDVGLLFGGKIARRPSALSRRFDAACVGSDCIQTE